MSYGIAFLSIIPVRDNPSDLAEQTTQLLFGETYRVLTKKKKWIEIIIDHDQYSGWISAKQHKEISQEESKAINEANCWRTIELVYPLAGKNEHIPITLGSRLFNYDGLQLKFRKERWTYNGQAVEMNEDPIKVKVLIKAAMRYLNAPYQWGGRSPLGIDCSGFIQNIFLCFNKYLPRDASQQASVGQVVHLSAEAKAGDLAFFDNEEGNITHVGLIIENDKIIHASGKVRIDHFDHYGIYNLDIKKYSHKLRVIKRLI